MSTRQKHPEPVFVNVYGAQESIPRNQFRQVWNRFLGSLKGLQIRALINAYHTGTYLFIRSSLSISLCCNFCSFCCVVLKRIIMQDFLNIEIDSQHLRSSNSKKMTTNCHLKSKRKRSTAPRKLSANPFAKAQSPFRSISNVVYVTLVLPTATKLIFIRLNLK